VVDLNSYFKANVIGPSLTKMTSTFLEFLIFTGMLNTFLLV
jgi:hypothetical protein